MKRENMPFNTCQKLWEGSFVYYGKDSINYITNHLIAKASKGVFTTVNASVYSNASQHSGTIKAQNKFTSPMKS